MLEYKLQDRGKVFHKIDKWYASSTTCSNCGTKHKEIVNGLAVRKWVCPTCGCSHNRDVNAAVNIRQQGIKEITVGTTGVSLFRLSALALSSKKIPLFRVGLVHSVRKVMLCKNVRNLYKNI